MVVQGAPFVGFLYGIAGCCFPSRRIDLLHLCSANLRGAHPIQPDRYRVCNAPALTIGGRCPAFQGREESAVPSRVPCSRGRQYFPGRVSLLRRGAGNGRRAPCHPVARSPETRECTAGPAGRCPGPQDRRTDSGRSISQAVRGGAAAWRRFEETLRRPLEKSPFRGTPEEVHARHRPRLDGRFGEGSLPSRKGAVLQRPGARRVFQGSCNTRDGRTFWPTMLRVTRRLLRS